MRRLFSALLVGLLASVGGAICTPNGPYTYTTKVGIKQPAINNCSWGTDLNNDFGIIDSSFGILGVNNTWTSTNTFSNPIIIKGPVRFYDQTTHYIQLQAASSVATTNFTLPAADGSSGQALTTNGSGVLSFNTISGGSGGSSSLQITQSGVQITSPTASINFTGPPFVLSANGSTSTIALNASSVTLQGQNVIDLTSSLQSGATYFVSSGTVAGKFTVTGNGNLLTLNQSTVGSVSNGISFTQKGTSNSSISQLYFGGTCSDLSTGCLASPFELVEGSSVPYIFNSDGRFSVSGSTQFGSAPLNRFSSVVGGSLIVGNSGYTDIQNIGTNNILAGGVIAATGTYSTGLTVAGQNVCQANGTNCPASSGGSSALQVTSNGVQITSPTASMNFSPNFTLATVGSTATVNLSQTINQSETFSSSITIGSGGAGQAALTQGADSGIIPTSGISTLWASSSSGTLVFENGTVASTYTVVGTSITPTVGQCAAFSNTTGAVISVACGSGGGGSSGGSIVASPQFQVPNYSLSGTTTTITGTSNLTNNGSTVNVIQTNTGNVGALVITSTGTGIPLQVIGQGSPGGGVQQRQGYVTIGDDTAGKPVAAELVIVSSRTDAQVGAGHIEVWVDSPNDNDPVYWEHRVSNNSAPDARFDAPAPNEEVISISSSGATNGRGKWEAWAVPFQSEILQVNSRSWDNSTFENLAYWEPLDIQAGFATPGLYLQAQNLANDSGVLTSTNTSGINFFTQNNHTVGLTGPLNVASGSWRIRLPSTIPVNGQILQVGSADTFGDYPTSWVTNSGSGGSSSLQVTQSGIQITSPTVSINFNANDFGLTAVGSTSTVALNPNTTNFIHNNSGSAQTAQESITGSINTNSSYSLNSNIALWDGGAPSSNLLFVGSRSASSLSGASADIFEGILSGQSITSGSQNTCVGEFSCQTLSNGAQNTVVGEAAFVSSSSGTENVLVGYIAGQNITSGFNNTCSGYDCFDLLTTGTNNAAFGSGSAADITSGSGNTCIGGGGSIQPCQGIKSGNNNTMVGGQSGNTAYNGNESSNTLIGALTSSNVGVMEATAIGYNALATSSNTIQMGGSGADAERVIMSSFNASSGTVAGQLTANTFVIGNLGLNNTGIMFQNGQTLTNTSAFEWNGTTMSATRVSASTITATTQLNVTGALGENVTYGLTVGSGTFTTALTVAGQNVCQANGTNCPSSGGGSSVLAVTTGTVAGFSTLASSPTSVLNFDNTIFSSQLTGTSTNFISIPPSAAINISSMTINGNGLGGGSNVIFKVAPNNGLLVQAGGNVGVGKVPSFGLDVSQAANFDTSIQSQYFQSLTNLKPATVITASGANFGVVENRGATSWDLGYSGGATTQGTQVLRWDSSPAVNILSSATISGANGLNVTFGVVAGTITAVSYSGASSAITSLSPLTLRDSNYAKFGTGSDHGNDQVTIEPASTGIVDSLNIYTIGGVSSLAVSTNNEIVVNGSTGTVGQVLTSGGPNASVSWANASAGGGGIVSPGTFTWVNNFGLRISTVAMVNSTSPNTLTISSSSTGVNLVAVSSVPAVNPSDFLINASSITQVLTLGLQYDGHLVSSGTTPSVASCGTGSPSVNGTDLAGVITVGGGSVTSCTLNFAYPYANPPVCTESDSSTTPTADITSISTTGVTFGFSATIGGGSIWYICIGNKG